MPKEYKMTADGLKKLEQELETLKTVTRKENAEKLKIARSFGDLSENSEYDEAKNDQAKTEARIAELEEMRKNAVIVDESEYRSDIVGIGSKVTVLDVEFGDEIVYEIVGASEADPLQDRISDESPVGRALIGNKKGATVEVEVPAGKVVYKIKKITK